MAKYRKKPVEVEASQWFAHGDHPKVEKYLPDAQSSPPCSECGKPLADHGRIATLEGHHIVCPGDWVITGVAGEHYPCKPEIFNATYSEVR